MGQRRKLLAQASRNGFFVAPDLSNGKNLVTTTFVESPNCYKSIDERGQPGGYINTPAPTGIHRVQSTWEGY